ncbi:sugar phosphate isomerase/epimerase [Aliifodinibius sp. S!AR15-10]|uniref:sugar phosphate isomerase/epimerase family protein n=1 Tax=Aliifodinibius sp. S!AR15-10 TaxID=2950437 RepID=UPI002863B071|nr:sugar phosphate isomerase/epimerase family protein [Aliifodinibius sp. S!AR15-10]MDR8392521.1 sugar phosphate isomerase/epimerase [Aliifodinibius sp. S!AR15-10]
MNQDRRTFLTTVGKAMLGTAALTSLPAGSLFSSSNNDLFFDISLAQWSLHKALFGGELDNLDFAATAKNEFGISAVEYVNQFFKDKAEDTSYLKQMKQRADDNGVRSVLIMCDGEGALGDPDSGERQQAVENHYKWVTAAKYLGCHSIRVNAQSRGSWDEQMSRAADGLRSLTEFAAQHDINVIVENHGGLSSNAEWLVGVMKQVDHPRCGTLPDFGNFNISENESYDRYKGTRLLMPYAKGVSAKSYNFDSSGNETTIDFEKMLSIVEEAGYTGYVGVEYEGSELSEYEGIKATKALLEKVGA